MTAVSPPSSTSINVKEKKVVFAPKATSMAALNFLVFRLFISLHRLSLLKACPIPGTCVRGPKPLAEKERIRKRKNPPRKHWCNYIR